MQNLLGVFMAMMIVGCATTPRIAYLPVGDRDTERCIESNNCIMDTELGEAIVSFGEKSAVTLSFVGSGEGYGEVQHYDLVATVTNSSDSDLEFDPASIHGYDPEALVAELQSNGTNIAMGTMIGLAAIATVLDGAGHTSGLGMSLISDPKFLAVMQQHQIEADKIDELQREFANQKVPKKLLQPEETIAGRVILRSEAVTSGTSINVLVPVEQDHHRFQFVVQRSGGDS